MQAKELGDGLDAGHRQRRLKTQTLRTRDYLIRNCKCIAALVDIFSPPAVLSHWHVMQLNVVRLFKIAHCSREYMIVMLTIAAFHVGVVSEYKGLVRARLLAVLLLLF